MLHRVYYLFHPETGALIYIGRTINLPERIRSFKKRTGIDPVLGLCQRHRTFEDAANAEVAAILKHKPAFNKIAVVTKGNLGLHFQLSDETKIRMSFAHAGHRKSAETRQRMSKPKSPEHREQLRINLERARLCRNAVQVKEI